MIRTDWARKTFALPLRFPEHIDQKMHKHIIRWEERCLAAKLLVGEDKETRRARSSATAGVKDAAERMANAVRMRALLQHAGGKCYLCGEHLESDKANRDHIFPKRHMHETLGRIITSGNVMPVHPECNTAKNHRMPTEAEIAIAREAYAAADFRFFDQDPSTFHTTKARMCSPPPLIAEITG